MTDFPPDREGKGKFSLNTAVWNTVHLRPLEILESNKLHGASLDSVSLRPVPGADVNGSARWPGFLQTCSLPALGYPQAVITLEN